MKTKTLITTDADSGKRIGLTIRQIPAQPGVAPALVHIENGISWSMCLTEADATKLFQALAVVLAPEPVKL